MSTPTPVGNTTVADVAQFVTLITPFITVISVVIAARLSYSATSKAKAWELRRIAYSEILLELSTVERICDVASEYIQENAEAYFAREASSKHNAAISKHMAVVRGRYAMDYLIFSTEFIKVCEQLWATLDSIPPDEIPPEEHASFADAIKKFRPKLLTRARAEIDMRR